MQIRRMIPFGEQVLRAEIREAIVSMAWKRRAPPFNRKLGQDCVWL